MRDTFMTMKWRELANHQSGKLSRVDWSWLDKPKTTNDFDRLMKSEWDTGYERVLRRHCEFTDKDIHRTKCRMAMGALRYGPMSTGQFAEYSREYYLMRIDRAVAETEHNLEGCYDLANLIRLATEARHLHPNETISFLNMLSILFEHCVKENVPYVPEDRKD